MSDSGHMGATETLVWLLDSGDTLVVTVDRGALAKFFADKVSRRDWSGHSSLSYFGGGLVATVEKTK